MIQGCVIGHDRTSEGQECITTARMRGRLSVSTKKATDLSLAAVERKFPLLYPDVKKVEW